MPRSILPVCCLLLALAGCTVGPDYQPPVVPLPANWSEAPTAAAADPSQELAEWWTRFDDAELTSLVGRAVRNNRDLAVAEARVTEARALRGVAAADLWPTLNAGAGGLVTSGSYPQLFFGALDSIWEIDVFGGIRRSVEAADADVQVSIEQRRAVLLFVVGAVASTYVELRGFEAQIDTVRQNLAAQQATRELTMAQRDAGLASDLDVERARALVATTASELPLLQTARQENVHRLGVLLGESPAALAGELAVDAPIPSAPVEVVVGVPAELLRRRPDLGRAERELAAATARVGEAIADLYPRFTLTGSVGLRSEEVKDLLKGASGFAAIGPNVVWPIFAGGRIISNIEAQDARSAAALARYEKTVLDALEQVENALVRYAQEQVRRRELTDAVDANREAAAMARRLYANGLIEFLDVLVAERSLLESESRLVASETAVSSSLVTLYVSLGGGWPAAEAIELSMQ